MRRFLSLLTLLLGWSAGAQSPEELYEEYITPETRAVLERFEQAEREVQAAEAAARARKTLMLAVAVLIGLIPVVVTGRRILKEKTWKDNPGGTVRALGVALAGGVVLFGLNYGVLYLKLKYGDGFNTTLAFLIVAGLVAGSIYLLNKKGDGS
ncbi:MAG: hypothetical protein VZQ48_00315 [Candidatus Cryptobacteroides sp.]|nr:hypothetical protein [Candidatus Cryptobacteroides sp.]